jgi:hypothetical protein
MINSNALKDFIDEITFKNRNPKTNSVLNIINENSNNPIKNIPENFALYRDRIYTEKETPAKTRSFMGYSEKESFVPPKEKTKDMRANYRYIPYLYCSDSPYIAIAETRPRLKMLVSLATINVLSNLKLFDLTLKNLEKTDDSVKELYDDLSELFSKPITFEDDILDYIPTQYIAEYIKNIGYDGIMYKSLFWDEEIADIPNFSNIVIFNKEKC